MKKKQYIIGIDLGGTKIAAAVSDKKGTPLFFETIPTEAAKGKKHVISRIAFLARSVCAKAGIPFSLVKSIGIGAPGTIDDKSGIIRNAPNLPGWSKVALKDILQRSLKKTVLIENDANCAAIAELKLGAGKPFKSFVYVTISTGIGAGIIIDGKLFRGYQGTAGEVGHTVIDINGPKCGCGRIGHFEALASGPAISKRCGMTTHDLNAMAKKGDKNAIKTVQKSGKLIGIGLGNVVNILNPEAIIIGGGISNFGKLLFDSIGEQMKTSVLDGIKYKIIPAKLKKDVGVLGAIALCL